MTNSAGNYAELILRAKALAEANRRAQADKEKRQADIKRGVRDAQPKA